MTDMKRRDVLRYSAAGAVTAATALVGAQALTGTDPASGQANAAPKDDPRDFDELYKGRRIRGRHLLGGRDELLINNKKLALTVINTLFIPEDGSEPYVAMAWISAINHYDPVEIDRVRNREGLKKLGKKVVDILREFDLTDEAAQAHFH